MRAFFAFLFAFAIGCAEPTSGGTINGQPAATVSVPPPAPFDPVKATAKGKEFVTGLYGSKNPNGPICLPEKVSGDYTQCSFTYNETDGTLKAGTILCSNRGCFEGQAPVAVPAEDRPTVQIVNGQTQDNNDWLLWYLMFSNGGTSYHYHTWYDSTPAYGRTAYYSTTYVPTSQSRSYYTTTYSKPVSTASTTKYSTKTTPTVTASSSRSSGYSSGTTTSSATKSTSSSSSSSTTKSTSTSRSSGWGNSSRSSGYRSSGSRGGRR